MWRLLALLIVLCLIPACTATLEPPKARIVVPAGSDGGGGPPFCPPGHAKKGWC